MSDVVLRLAPREVVKRLLITEFELAAAYVRTDQHAQLVEVLDSIGKDVAEYQSLDVVPQASLDAYPENANAREDPRPRPRRRRKSSRSTRSRSETKKAPCPKCDRLYTVPMGLRTHARRAHGKSLEELQKEADE